MSQGPEKFVTNAPTEEEILPLQHKDRTPDNPMGTVMGFMGITAMTELAVSGLDAAANGFEGFSAGPNVELAGQVGGGVVTNNAFYQPEGLAPTPEMSFDINDPLMAGPTMGSPI